MATRCPYLGLADHQDQVFAVPSSRHRCYRQGQAERIGSAHQAGTCLTSAYHHCPRLLARQVSRTEAAEWTSLRQAAVARGERAHRAPTLTELAVVGLGLSIVLACSFLGYVILYRLRVGPGMAAIPQAAEGQGLGTADISGLAPGHLLPTLVLTFTPLPPPTIPLSTAVAGVPTPIPEPTLPLAASASRPPATSPPTRLVIPKIALDIPVLPVGAETLNDGKGARLVWADVPYAGGFHQTSAYPGNPGNTVINGHRDIYAAVFRHLDQVGVGDQIVVYVGEVAYPYSVAEILVVPETFASADQRTENLRFISYMPEERLTLVTCTPVGLATHRLLVIAKPPDQIPP